MPSVLHLPSIGEWEQKWTRVGGGWVAADGFGGVRHPTDGRYMFLHGDTFVERDGLRFMPHTSVTVWDGANIVMTSEPDRDFIPPAADGTSSWYWHGDLFWDGPDLWVFALKVKRASGGWGFATLSRDLVQLTWPWRQVPKWVATYPAPFPKTDGQPVDWGSSAVRVSPYVYVYGVQQIPGAFGHRVFLARVQSGRLPSAGAWRFYAGADSSGAVGWAVSQSDMVPVMSESAGPSGTFSSELMNGMWRITSKLHGDFGSDVSAWEGPNPWGPFTRRTVVSVPWSSADQTYGAWHHPDAGVLPDGRTVVSVNHNSDVGLGRLWAEPWRYRPSWHVLP
jgi:hypothetical protein